MALYYETGNVLNQVDLLDKLSIFLVANGWVVDNSYVTSESKNNTLFTPDDGSAPIVQAGKVYNWNFTDSYGEHMHWSCYACSRCVPTNVWQNWSQYTTDFQGLQRMYPEVNGLVMYPHTDYTATPLQRGVIGAGAGWDFQTGYPTGANVGVDDYELSTGCAKINYMNGQQCTYWFFRQGNTFHVVVKVWANIYQHLSFGTLVKQGQTADPYTGGQFCVGQHNTYRNTEWYSPATPAKDTQFGQMTIGGAGESGIFRMLDSRDDYQLDNNGFRPFGTTNFYYGQDVLGHCNAYLQGPGTVPTGILSIPRSKSLISYALQGTPNIITNVSIQTPIYFMVDSSIGDYQVGHPEGVRFINVKNLTSESIITLGAETWQVFPMRGNDASDPQYPEGVPGLAYKKV